MVEFTAFRLLRAVALLFSVAAIVALASPASARTHRHHAAARHHHYASDHHHYRGYAMRHSGRRAAEAMQAEQFGQPGFGFAPNYQAYQPNYQQPTGYADPTQQAVAPRGRRARLAMRRMQQHAEPTETQAFSGGGFSGGGSSIVATARSYIGGNPTGRSSLWCARFMNMVLQRSGHRGTGSDMASSFAHYGQRLSGPQVGAIAVMSRRGGGHVGIVSGIDSSGNPIVVSGNHNHRVAESVYSKGRIYAYVMPTS